ncbi:MAG: hypothetical protein QXO71_01230, partial [Candidatus Jordarchaeaceae archaeon]
SVLTPSRYLTLAPGTVFDSWGPWFAVGTSSGAGGVMLLNDTYIYMNSSSSITYKFLQNANDQAAITLTKSSSYPKAEMYVSTRNQSITGLGSSTITNGGISTSGYSDVKNITKITQGAFTFTGNMLVKGNSSIQGNIDINGYNNLQAPIIITGQINVNNGLMSGAVILNLPNGRMETEGIMSINSGEMNITGGTMQMNSTGIFVYGASSTSIKGSITSNGILEITGSQSIQGNIVINGPNYIQELINISPPLMALSGAMATNGIMSIDGGAINIQNGRMVMNSSGSFITGTVAVIGVVDFVGDATLTGNIGINGRNYMQGDITVAQLSLANGVMDTTGTMSITNGMIVITGSHMVMNGSGSFITGGSTVVTGTIMFTGAATISSNHIELSGYNYMQGDVITVQGNMNINNGKTRGALTLTIRSTMETRGTMTIVNGAISLPGTITMVMNSSGSYIMGDTISVTGEQINSAGTITADGDITIRGDIEMSGNNYIKGPVSISGALSINGGTMTGTGTITVSDGYMQTVGNMKITNATITVSGKIVMDSSGTHIGSTTSITGDSITVTGMVTNAGSVKMTGTFVLLVPLSMTGMMLTNGITAMGGLGTITGAMNIMGNIMMSGVTVISGDNNIMGTMTVTPYGVSIYGMVGLTGIVYTSSMPNIGSSTVLELLSGSIMGMSIPHMSIMMNPLALVALGVLGLGTVYVVGRIVYFGIKERRTLVQLVRIYGREIGRSISGRVRRLFRRSS